jgi:hypothetical protein
MVKTLRHTLRLVLQAAVKARAAVDKARKARAPLSRAQQVLRLSNAYNMHTASAEVPFASCLRIL